MITIQQKLQALADLIEKEKQEYFSRPGWTLGVHLQSCKVKIVPGKKYVKVDVGGSGAYMVVAETGEIFGSKAYGVIHRGHYFGTLDTINDYYWGDYRAVRKRAAAKVAEVPPAPGTIDDPIRYERVAADDPDRQAKLKAQREKYEQDAKAGQVLCLSDLMISHGM